MLCPKRLRNPSPSCAVARALVSGLLSSFALLLCSHREPGDERSHPEEEIRPYPAVLRTCHGSRAPCRESLNGCTCRINGLQKLVPASRSPRVLALYPWTLTSFQSTGPVSPKRVLELAMIWPLPRSPAETLHVSPGPRAAVPSYMKILLILGEG